MGVNGSSSYTKTVYVDRIIDTNPDPTKYKFIDAMERGEYLVVKINYPNCTNFEGNKILVYKCKLIDLVNQKSIDPHFSDKKDYIAPIARFAPTPMGWHLAIRFIDNVLIQPQPDF